MDTAQGGEARVGRRGLWRGPWASALSQCAAVGKTDRDSVLPSQAEDEALLSEEDDPIDRRPWTQQHLEAADIRRTPSLALTPPQPEQEVDVLDVNVRGPGQSPRRPLGLCRRSCVALLGDPGPPARPTGRQSAGGDTEPCRKQELSRGARGGRSTASPAACGTADRLDTRAASSWLEEECPRAEA